MAYISISRGDFSHNVGVFRAHISRLNDRMKLAMVLKDNAYGHGLEIMAGLCLDLGIKDAFVKNFREVLRLQESNLLGGFDSLCYFYGSPGPQIRSMPNVIATIRSLDCVRVLRDVAGVGQQVELKVNIGMNRNGLDVDELMRSMQDALDSGLVISGVFAHNGFSDDGGPGFDAQVSRFGEVKALVRDFCALKGIPVPRLHSMGTSSVLRVNESDEDLVRVGIGLYGYSRVNPGSHSLRPILRLYAHRISTRLLRKGDSIGYGGVSVADADSTCVSTYDLGYGDGLYRVDGDRTFRTPCGLDILPTSSMDCFSLFGSDDVVCVIDDAEYVASVFGTIPGEVLCRLSPFLERRLVD